MFTYSEDIMERVRMALGHDANNKDKDAEIMEMDKIDILELCLRWEGIMGYSSMIIDIINNIYGVYLDD